MGIGVAIGMVAGTTGLEGAARGRMTVLTVAIGLVLGYMLTSLADGSIWPGAIFSAALAGLGCAATSDVVAGSSRRGGSTWALSLIVILLALVVAALSFLLPLFGLLATAMFIWLTVTRRRKGERKYAGLRILK